MKLSRQDVIYNKRVQAEKDAKSFPKRVRVIFGACILIGLLISLALFIGTVRATEEIVRHWNQ